jgi:hypothetical protein
MSAEQQPMSTPTEQNFIIFCNDLITEQDRSSKQQNQNGSSDTNVWLDAVEQQPISIQWNKILLSCNGLHSGGGWFLHKPPYVGGPVYRRL